MFVYEIPETCPSKILDLIDCICAEQEIHVHLIFSTSRGTAKVCFTRQICMYLTNTYYGYSLTDVGKFFGRDRTTVAHTCRKVEDLRSNITFDNMISSIEDSLGEIE